MKRPVLIIISGVSGSGKSSVARELSRLCALRYLDADDYHSSAARALMARGTALDDEMRIPWIQSICRHLRQLAIAGENCVLAYPGLKKSHREPLRKAGFDVTFLYLEGDRDLIRQRLENRRGHFMRAELLKSQFRSLERPVNESDVQFIDTSTSLENVVNQALAIVRQQLPGCHPEVPHPRGNDES